MNIPHIAEEYGTNRTIKTSSLMPLCEGDNRETRNQVLFIFLQDIKSVKTASFACIAV